MKTWLKKTILGIGFLLNCVVSALLATVIVIVLIPLGILFTIIIFGVMGVVGTKSFYADLKDWAEPPKEETEDGETEDI